MPLNNFKIVHCKKSKFDIYIGRPSIFGNRYSWHKKNIADFQVNTREESIILCKLDFLRRPEVLRAINSLKGDETFGCFCNVEKEDCHGNVIIELWEDIRNGRIKIS